MPAPTSTAELIDLVRKSGLYEGDAFDNRLGDLPRLPDQPTSSATLLVKHGLITKFQAKLLLLGKYRGFRIGPYTIKEQIGQGGMGAVYLAEHVTLLRKVALKVLTPGADDDTKLAVERFLREARSAAALDHPNIVRLHDVGQFGTSHYLVMEFVEGDTLDKLVQKGTSIPAGRAVEYIAQAAAGLQHAYEKGFVHRDIKPANLILAKDGTVKILDMGLARSSEERDKLTANIDVGAIVGTADYISPEQAVNDPKIDIRADIYSLGATFYALVTGRPPFAGNTTQKLVQHQMKDAPSLTRMDKTLPKDLAEVVAKMMAKKKEQRFRTPAEVIAALAPWLPNSGKVVAGLTHTEAGALGGASQDTMDRIVASSTKSLTKSIKRAMGNDRKKWAYVGGGVAAVLLVGTVLGWLIFGGSGKPDTAKGPSPAPAPANPAAAAGTGSPTTIYRLDLSTLKPFSVRIKGANVVAGERGVFPPGVSVYAQGNGAESEFGVVTDARGAAMSLTHLSPATGTQLACELEKPVANGGAGVTLAPGAEYKLRIECRTDGAARMGVGVHTIVGYKPAAEYTLLSLVKGDWQVIEVPFSRSEAGALRFVIENRGQGRANAMFVRSAEVVQLSGAVAPVVSPAPRAATAVAALPKAPPGTLYRPDFRPLLGTNFSVESYNVTAGTKPNLPPTLALHCWKPGSTGDFRVELVEGVPAVRIASRNEPASAQARFDVESEGGTTLAEGKDYDFRVTYRTEGDVKAKMSIMTTKFKYLGGAELPPSEGGWKTVTVTKKRDDQPLCCSVNVESASPAGFLTIGAVDVVDPDAPKAPPPFFAMAFAGMTPGVRPILATDAQRQGTDIGGQPLPRGVMLNQYAKDTAGEYSLAIVDGAVALGLRHLDGNGGTQVNVSVEEEDKLAVGDAVTIRIVYQYRGTGSPYAAMEEGGSPYKKYNQTSLPPTGAQWKTVEIPFERPPYPQKMNLILNPGKATHADRALSTLYVQSLAILHPGAAPATETAKAPPAPPAAPAIGAGQIAYDLKTADWKPFRFTLEGTKVTAGTKPTFPTGLNLHCWKAGSIAQFAGADQGEGFAVGMTNLNDDVSAQLMTPLEFGNDVFLIPGKKYAVRVEYRTTNDGAGAVALQTDDYATLGTTPLDATGGRWAIRDVPFTRQDGKPVRVAVNSTGVGEGNTLYVRRVTVFEVK